MARLQDCKCCTQELLEQQGLKDRFVQGRTSVQHVSHSPHYLPFPVWLGCQIMRHWAAQCASLCLREAGPALKPVGHQPPPCNLCAVAGWSGQPGRARACPPLQVAAWACFLHPRGRGLDSRPDSRPAPQSSPCQHVLEGLKVVVLLFPRLADPVDGSHSREGESTQVSLTLNFSTSTTPTPAPRLPGSVVHLGLLPSKGSWPRN